MGVTDDWERSPAQITASIIIGIIVSFVITSILGIDLPDYFKMIIVIVPAAITSGWAVKAKRIDSIKLWLAVSHGIVYGLINLVADKAFFYGIESMFGM